MPNPTRYKINRVGERMESFHEYSYSSPSAVCDARTPMIDKQDQYEYVSIEKVLGDVRQYPSSEGSSIEQRVAKFEVKQGIWVEITR
jgi:hypothetical protein